MRATWFVAAPGVGFVMSRLGHDTFTWGVFGLIAGPFAIRAARDSKCRERREASTFAGLVDRGSAEARVEDLAVGADQHHGDGPGGDHPKRFGAHGAVWGRWSLYSGAGGEEARPGRRGRRNP